MAETKYVNDLTLKGDITGDIRLTYTPSGIAKVFFLLNVPEKYNGEMKDHKIRVVAWRDEAERIANTFSEGEYVTVHGMVKFGRYKGKDDVWKDDIHALAFNVTGDTSIGVETAPPDDDDSVPF